MRSTDCGFRIADCGMNAHPSNPQSAIRNPQLLVGALLLALLPPPAGAQQPDSLPKDSATLAPVVVTGVRLPSVRELARGLAGRTAALSATDLDARGASPPSRELEASAGSFGRYELKAHAGARHGVWDYYLGARYEREDGWRDDTQSRIATLFAKAGVLNHTWDATLSYSGADNKIFQAGSLPETELAQNPRANFTRGDFFAPQAHLAVLNAQRLVGRGAQLAVNAFGRTLNSEQFNANFVGEDSRQRTATRQAGGAVQLSGKLGLGGRALHWLAGADAAYQHTAVRIFEVPPSGPDSLTESVRTNEVDLGAFAGANWEIARSLTATVAARYDWIRLPVGDLVDPSQNRP